MTHLPLILQILSLVCLLGLFAYGLVLFFQQIRVGRWNRKVLAMERTLWQANCERAVANLALPSKGKSGWSGIRKFVVKKKNSECSGITSFYLEPHDKKALESFLPGQFLTVQVPLGVGGSAVRRCYSLSNIWGETAYRITVKKIRGEGKPGQVSGYLADHVAEGDILDVRAPNGKFFYDLDDPKPAVFIAGGIGITPILSMLKALAAYSGKRPPCYLFYGVRNGEHYPFRNELSQITSTFPELNVVISMSQPNEGDAFDHHGRVNLRLLKDELPSSNFDFYLCGPSAMTQQLHDDLIQWGVPQSQLFFESFGASTAKTFQAKDTGPCAVTFAKSQKTVEWRPEKGTLLDLAESEGVPIESGCRTGNCGVCQTAVREGSTQTIKAPGVDVEPGVCLACISTPESPLVLDL